MEPCRWATPDEQGYCKRCGWPTVAIKGSTSKIGVVTPAYFRHKRPPGYTHKRRSVLSLSEASGGADRENDPAIKFVRHNINFRKRTGAGDRIVLPDPAEWIAFNSGRNAVYPQDDGSLAIDLGKGNLTYIDAADREIGERYPWRVDTRRRTSYAFYRYPRRRMMITLHREIMGLKKGDGRQVDHIDGDGLNNRRANLRICSPHQNLMHKRGHRDSTSEYVGVHYSASSKAWHAQVRSRHVGTFTSEIEAALARDRVALEEFGAFAFLNFPEEASPLRKEFEWLQPGWVDTSLFEWRDEDGTEGKVTISDEEMSCTCTTQDERQGCIHVQGALSMASEALD